MFHSKRKKITWDQVVLKKYQQDGYEKQWIEHVISAVERNNVGKKFLPEEKSLLAVIIIKNKDEIYSAWEELEIEDEEEKNEYLNLCIDAILEPTLWQKTVSDYIKLKAASSASFSSNKRTPLTEIEKEVPLKKRKKAEMPVTKSPGM